MHKMTELEAFRIRAAVAGVLVQDAPGGRMTTDLNATAEGIAVEVRRTLGEMGIAFYAPDLCGELTPQNVEEMRTRLYEGESALFYRIKVVYEISDLGLKESKDWVHSHFADDGAGDPL